MFQPLQVRLANSAIQEGCFFKQSNVVITAFLENIAGNGVLAKLERLNDSKTPLDLGVVGGNAEIVSIDVGETTSRPNSPTSPDCQTAMSLGQGFLFGIINEKEDRSANAGKSEEGRRVPTPPATAPLATRKPRNLLQAK